MYPSHITDLLSENPLIVTGRYRGKFPDTLKVKGVLANLSNFLIDLKIDMAKDIPLDRVRKKLVSSIELCSQFLIMQFWAIGYGGGLRFLPYIIFFLRRGFCQHFCFNLKLLYSFIFNDPLKKNFYLI